MLLDFATVGGRPLRAGPWASARRRRASTVVPVPLLEKASRLGHDLLEDLGGRLYAYDFEHAFGTRGHVHLFEVARGVPGGNDGAVFRHVVRSIDDTGEQE